MLLLLLLQVLLLCCRNRLLLGLLGRRRSRRRRSRLRLLGLWVPMLYLNLLLRRLRHDRPLLGVGRILLLLML